MRVKKNKKTVKKKTSKKTLGGGATEGGNAIETYRDLMDKYAEFQNRVYSKPKDEFCIHCGSRRLRW